MAGRRDRGQSEVIGTLLMVALITIVISSVGAVVIYNHTQNLQRQSSFIECEIEYTNDNVTITHFGGESVDVDSLETVLRNDTRTNRLAFTEGTGEDQFDPGDSAVFGQISNETDVLLVGGDEVICQSTVTPGTTTTPTPTPTPTPTSAESIEAVESEGVDTQSSQIQVVIGNTGSDTVTIVDFAVDATAISNDIWIDDGNNPEFETSGATDNGNANDEERKDASFLADGTTYRLEDNNGENATLKATDDSVTVTFRAFGPDDKWIDDSDELELVDNEADADVIIYLGLSDGSTSEVYLQVV